MRHRHLVAYDVRDARRLRRVHREMRGFGDALQYSVFQCDLSTKERVLMEEALKREMNLKLDRAMIVDLGPVAGGVAERVAFIGVVPAEDVGAGGAVIV
ncbi:MAG: CRISPR-associated endonuclease Cas2 [Planctomycetes bacterium]|nr:CRISPR-associated endonuclease Cas2 [Planctomycetota bacterium]